MEGGREGGGEATFVAVCIPSMCSPKVSMHHCSPVVGRSLCRKPIHQFVHRRNVVSLARLILFGPPGSLPANIVA